MGLGVKMKRWKVPEIVPERSEGLGDAMWSMDVAKLKPEELLQTRGW